MTLSGFTFIRNGRSLGYPFEESLASLLRVCDDVTIAVGRSDDDTRDYVASLGDPRLRIIDTVWDDSLREGGRILAQQTDVALAGCTGDWCLYLQGDEVLHEADDARLRAEILRADGDPAIEALLFRWIHLFGSYDYQGVGRQWYRREIRAVRNTGKVMSWGDAQGFRTRESDGTVRKLRARQTECRIFHYGWVRHPRHQAAKAQAMNRLYHNNTWMAENIPSTDEFHATCYDIAPYTGGHPACMQERIRRDRVWTSAFDPVRATTRKPFRVAVSDSLEKITGWRMFEYRNFDEVR